MNVLRSLQIGFEDRSVTFLERWVVELIAIVYTGLPPFGSHSATFPHVSRMAIDNLHVRLIFDLRLHSSYAFFIRAYTHVKVEFALHPTYEITKFIKGQHSVLCMI